VQVAIRDGDGRVAGQLLDRDRRRAPHRQMRKVDTQGEQLSLKPIPIN
jgi:hypothetical protein